MTLSTGSHDSLEFLKRRVHESLTRQPFKLGAQPQTIYVKPKASSAVKALPDVVPKRSKAGPSTRQELKLIDTGALISTNPPNGDDMAFSHAVLCQVGLPRSKFGSSLNSL